MTKPRHMVLELPSEKDIESVKEISLSPGVIRKTVRYTNGLEIVFNQTVYNCVFSIHLKSGAIPLWINQNQVFVLETTSLDEDNDE